MRLDNLNFQELVAAFALEAACQLSAGVQLGQKLAAMLPIPD